MSDFIPDKDSLLTKEYQKLLFKINNNSLSPIEEWTIMDSLAYICIKYKQKFNKDFVFTYDNTPSKSYEYKCTSKVWMVVQAKRGDGNKVKEYIDWFYDNYTSKNSFRSINAIAKIETANRFSSFKSKEGKINLTSVLSQIHKDIINKYPEASYAKTYGDLIFLIKSIEGQNNESLNNMVKELKDKGFDYNNQ